MKSFTSPPTKFKITFSIRNTILPVILLLTLFSLDVNAARYDSWSSGAWDSPGTWRVDNQITNSIPSANDDVYISDYHTVTIPADYSALCNNLTIGTLNGNGAKLLLTPGTSLFSTQLVVANLLIINGGGSKGINELEITTGRADIGAIKMEAVSNSRTAKISVTNGYLKVANEFLMILATGNSSKYSFLQILNEINPSDTYSGIVELGGAVSIMKKDNGSANSTISPIDENVFELDKQSTVIFKGQVPQTIPSMIQFGKVIIDNPAEVTPKGNIVSVSANTTDCIIRGGLEVKGGKLVVDKQLNLAGLNTTIDAGNIIIKPLGTISNASATNYIKQTGAGKLIIENIGPGARTGNILFPVGTTSYTPAFINNNKPGSAVSAFSVNVVSGVMYNNIGLEYHAVNRTWNIKCENQIAPVDITLLLQWNQGDQMQIFNNTKCSIRHFNGTFWDRAMDALNGDRAATIVSGGGTPNAVYSIARTGITTFSPFAVGDELSPLPVELVYFKAAKRDNQALLTWETASEKNNKGFDIQASADGRNFETVGYVASKNSNANFSQRYEYLDKTSRSGLVYYRLKQTDFDGTVAFYAAKVIDMGRFSETIATYPNPFQNQFQVNINAASIQTAELILTDLTGKIIYHNNQPLTKGANTVTISLNNQPAGVYLLTARTETQAISTRLVKQ